MYILLIFILLFICVVSLTRKENSLYTRTENLEFPDWPFLNSRQGYSLGYETRLDIEPGYKPCLTSEECDFYQDCKNGFCQGPIIAPGHGGIYGLMRTTPWEHHGPRGWRGVKPVMNRYHHKHNKGYDFDWS